MGKVKFGKWEYTEEELEQQYNEATKRGEEALAREIQAQSVHYDRSSNRIVVELKNGATFIVPCELVQGLRGAAPEDIAEVELGPRGAALHWETLDVDFSVTGLMRGIFGNQAWMAALTRHGDKATSAGKPAARANRMKVERPPQEQKRPARRAK